MQDSSHNGFAIGRRSSRLLQVLVTLAVCLFATAPATAQTPEPSRLTQSGPPLADGLDKWLGTAYSQSQARNLDDYWNQVVPENGGKWGTVEGTRDQMNWAEADAAYNLAKANGWPFRYHVLVWGSQQPAWIAGLDSLEQRQEIEEWFNAVAERYPDIDYLEVVNEPLHQPPDASHSGNYIGALGGAGETGWDWVITAFEMARSIFPDSTKLVLNDYGILGSTSGAAQYRSLVQLLQERNLIDVIAMQAHAFSTRSGAPLQSVLDILAVTGLPLMITEMDVDGNPTQSPTVTEQQSDANQLADMQRIFPVLWNHDSVIGITFWGWRPGMWRTPQEAYLVRDSGAERPALVWLREYLESYRLPVEEDAVSPDGFLLTNYPNPFTGSTTIEFAIETPAIVRLTVHDMTGRTVETLVDEQMSPGRHRVTFDARGLAGGVYLYRLQAGSAATSRALIVTR